MITDERMCVWHPVFFPGELIPAMGEQRGATCDRCFAASLEEIANIRRARDFWRFHRGCDRKKQYMSRHEALSVMRNRPHDVKEGPGVYRCPYSAPRHWHIGHDSRPTEETKQS